LGKHSNKIIPLGKKAPPSFSLIRPGISHIPILLEIGSWRGRGWAMGVVVGGGGLGGGQSCDDKWVLCILGGDSLICTQLILVFEDFLVELDIW